MGDKPAKVPGAELAVLQALWEHGPATVRQLSEAVYPGGGASQYGTVHKLLERLESKNYVKRARRGREHIFVPTLGRDELLGRELETLVDKMCGGSLQPLLSHLIRVKGLTPQELHELLVLIEKLSAEPRSDRRRPKKGAE
jgi:predicted transcriptional regulator